jgi:hypothetical protein
MVMSDEPAMVFSGPLSRRGQVSKLLTSNGYALANGDPKHGHGLPAKTDGGDDPSVGWITVHGEDVDHAQEVLQGTGWGLRAHWPGVLRTSPLVEPEETLTEARVRQLIDESLQGVRK